MLYSHEKCTKEKDGMKKNRHDLKYIAHIVAEISSGEVPTHVETEDNHTVQSKDGENSPSVYGICELR